MEVHLIFLTGRSRLPGQRAGWCRFNSKISLSSCVCTHLAWRNGSTWGLLKTISYKKEVRIAALDFKRSTKWRNKCLWTNHVEVNSFPFHCFLFCVSSSLMAGWFEGGEGVPGPPNFQIIVNIRMILRTHNQGLRQLFLMVPWGPSHLVQHSWQCS